MGCWAVVAVAAARCLITHLVDFALPLVGSALLAETIAHFLRTLHNAQTDSGMVLIMEIMECKILRSEGAMEADKGTCWRGGGAVEASNGHRVG